MEENEMKLVFSLKSLGKKRRGKKSRRYYVNESRLHTRENLTRDTPPHTRCVHGKGGGLFFFKETEVKVDSPTAEKCWN